VSESDKPLCLRGEGDRQESAVTGPPPCRFFSYFDLEIAITANIVLLIIVVRKAVCLRRRTIPG
jgi:hypothetical protein